MANASFIDHNVATYNAMFDPLFDCPCYDRLRPFRERVIRDRRLYVCCIVLSVGGQGRVMHEVLPIMFGSNIDLHIRGDDPISDAQADWKLYGTYRLQGFQRYIPLFVTNNLGRGHVFFDRRRGTTVFKVTMHRDNVAIKLVYTPDDTSPTVDVQYTDVTTGQTLSADDDDIKPWIYYVSSGEAGGYQPSEAEYIDYMQRCVDHGPKLDHISNKVFVDSSRLMHTQITQLIQRSITDKPSTTEWNRMVATTANKIATALRNGNGFYALSKYAVNTLKEQQPTVYNNIEGQKLQYSGTLAYTCRRFMSTSTLNSRARAFPEDATHFVCPLSAKELRGVGESLSLSIGCIVSPPTPLSRVAATLSAIHSPTAQLRVVVDSVFTPYCVDTQHMLHIKMKHPYVTVRIVDGTYCVLGLDGAQLLKYSPHYRTFVSPWECHSLWPDAFQDGVGPMYSYNAPHLPPSFVMSEPSKAVVAAANVRGACCELDGPLITQLFLASPGLNSALLHRQPHLMAAYAGVDESTIARLPAFERYLLLTRSGGGDDAMPAAVAEMHAQHQRRYAHDPASDRGHTLADILTDADRALADMQAIREQHMMPVHTLSASTDRGKSVTQGMYRRALVNTVGAAMPQRMSAAPIVTATISSAGGNQMLTTGCRSRPYVTRGPPIHRKPVARSDVASTPHALFWTVYGDGGGCTVEDGIAIDSSVAACGPSKLLSYSSLVRFDVCGGKRRRPGAAVVTARPYERITYRRFDTVVGKNIVFGTVHSRRRLQPNTPKHVTVTTERIGGDYQYTVAMADTTAGFTKTVVSQYDVDKNTLHLHYTFEKSIGVGTKLSNMHGQKGIVARVGDYSHIKAWTADGRCVHAQVLYSPMSAVGRLQYSHIQDMADSNMLAFTVDHQMVVPCAHMVHHIEESASSHRTCAKVDLMTSENGFVANGLAFTGSVLCRNGHNDTAATMNQVTELHATRGTLLTVQ